jgi:hypothetical protein
MIPSVWIGLMRDYSLQLVIDKYNLEYIGEFGFVAGFAVKREMTLIKGFDHYTVINAVVISISLKTRHQWSC